MDSLGILWWRMDTVIPFGWMNGYDDMHADTILDGSTIDMTVKTQSMDR